MVDSYKSAALNIEWAPTTPLALVESVNVSNVSPKIGDTIEVSGIIKNGGATGRIEWNCCIGYEISPGSVTIIAGTWNNTTLNSNDRREFFSNIKITQEMYNIEIGPHNVHAYCLGRH